METFISSILGDLVGRSIFFVLDKYYQQQKGVEENLQRLHCLLLRIQSTVKEAEERHITNQAMLQQLHMMREGMHKGYYMLDAFRYRMLSKESFSDEVCDHSFALSKFNPSKRLCSSTRMTKILFEDEEITELEKMLHRLESTIADMKEFVVFLSSYPPMGHQPNSKYILLENCIFGRQGEQQRVISFLLDDFSAKSVDVLPIIGPPRVGKSTLIEHVCHDERVHKYFSLIVFYTKNNIGDENLVPLRETCVIKHQDLALTGKSLVIIEFEGDVDERTWRRILNNLNEEHIVPVSKIILISRSKKIATFGTTEALQLTFLPREAFWYFFKTISFGSTNPEEHPKLASICMAITPMINGSFIGANCIGGLLRANLRVQYWDNVFTRMKDWVNRHLLRFGEYPRETLSKGQPIHLWTMHRSQSVALFCSCYQASSAQHGDVPKITTQDVHTGSIKPKGKFEALVWTSNIPPYYSYLAYCETHAPQPHMMPRNKQLNQRRRVKMV